MELWKIEGTFYTNTVINNSYTRQHVVYVVCKDMVDAVKNWKDAVPEYFRHSAIMKKCSLLTGKTTKVCVVEASKTETTRDVEVLCEVMHSAFEKALRVSPTLWYLKDENSKEILRSGVKALLEYIDGE